MSLRESLGDLHHRPPAATPDIKIPAAGLEPRSQAGQSRQHEVNEDAREGFQRLGHLAHERLIMVLVRLARPRAKAVHVLPVILPKNHVNPGCAGEVEAGLRVAQDLVEMRCQAPPLAIAFKQPERERCAAEHICGERAGAKPRCELFGSEPRALCECIPHAELARDFKQVGGVVTSDQLIQLADLLGQCRRSYRNALGHHTVPTCPVPATRIGISHLSPDRP